uniref:Hexosyltransferase n=1 Tax=Steinernema glaseri TaxID=37863 RepID=A0A1I7Y4J6_9BILA
MAQPLNWINFSFLQSPNPLCTGDPLNLVVVHSAVMNRDRRNFMRATYFSKEIQQRYGLSPLFVLGKSRVPESNDLVRKEADSFGDILQIDVEETYHNITHKTRAWISYLNQQCGSQVKYILKMDDDVMMDIHGLQILLDHYRRQKRLVLCRTFVDGVVVRNPKSKWYLSREEYPIDNLGLYCQGMAYVLSGDLLKRLNENLRKVQYLWMDDWYVTHGLLRAANAIFIDIGRHYVSINSERELDSATKGAFKKYRKFFGHFRPSEKYPLAERLRVWSRLEGSTDCY